MSSSPGAGSSTQGLLVPTPEARDYTSEPEVRPPDLPQESSFSATAVQNTDFDESSKHGNGGVQTEVKKFRGRPKGWKASMRIPKPLPEEEKFPLACSVGYWAKANNQFVNVNTTEKGTGEPVTTSKCVIADVMEAEAALEEQERNNDPNKDTRDIESEAFQKYLRECTGNLSIEDTEKAAKAICKYIARRTGFHASEVLRVLPLNMILSLDSDHTLETFEGTKFHLLDTPEKFTFGMYHTMRERIFQLEVALATARQLCRCSKAHMAITPRRICFKNIPTCARVVTAPYVEWLISPNAIFKDIAEPQLPENFDPANTNKEDKSTSAGILIHPSHNDVALSIKRVMRGYKFYAMEEIIQATVWAYMDLKEFSEFFLDVEDECAAVPLEKIVCKKKHKNPSEPQGEAPSSETNNPGNTRRLLFDFIRHAPSAVTLDADCEYSFSHVGIECPGPEILVRLFGERIDANVSWYLNHPTAPQTRETIAAPIALYVLYNRKTQIATFRFLFMIHILGAASQLPIGYVARSKDDVIKERSKSYYLKKTQKRKSAGEEHAKRKRQSSEGEPSSGDELRAEEHEDSDDESGAKRPREE